MIGFKLTANGSNGFKQTRSAWTEGSMLALKIIAAADAKVNKTQMGKATGGALDGVEKNFKKIADAKFSSICSFGLKFTLFCTGDVTFKYTFESGKSAVVTQAELLKLMASKGDSWGDQVMIYFCAIIEDFCTANFSSTDSLVLTIAIDL